MHQLVRRRAVITVLVLVCACGGDDEDGAPIADPVECRARGGEWIPWPGWAGCDGDCPDYTCNLPTGDGGKPCMTDRECESQHCLASSLDAEVGACHSFGIVPSACYVRMTPYGARETCR